MSLDHSQEEKLHQALLSAYPDYRFLAQLCEFGLGLNLDEVAASSALNVATFDLIRWTKAQGRLEELINMAYVRNPGNELLRRYVTELDISRRYLMEWDCDYDIGISYADDVPREWLVKLLSDVQSSIVRKLGHAVSVPRLAAPVPPGMANNGLQIDSRRAACMITVLSPDYTGAPQTSDVSRLFLEQNVLPRLDPTRSTVVPSPQERLFLVEYSPMTRAQRPDFLRDLREYPLGKNGAEYAQQVNDLSDALVRVLKRLQERDTLPSNTPVVLLAEVTDDLIARRDDVKRYLIQAGAQVVPEMYYSRNPADFQRALEEDLGRANVYVQLLSEVPGIRASDLPTGYTGLQYEHAQAALLGNPQLRLMQWHRPDLSVNDVTVTDASHRALLLGRYVRAESIEEFKQAVVDALRPPAKPLNPFEALKKSEEPKGIAEDPASYLSGKFVYVSADSADRSHAEQVVCRTLKGKQIGYAMPLQSPDMKRVREFMEISLQTCDMALIVYGRAEGMTAYQQLMQCIKYTKQRENPLPIVALYDGPPGKPDMDWYRNVWYPRLKYLNCRADVCELEALLGML